MKKKAPGPYQSKLEDHYDYILDLRKRRKTWQEIAALLQHEKNISTSYSNVFTFMSRRKHGKRYPLGMEPDFGQPLEQSALQPKTKPFSPIVNQQPKQEEQHESSPEAQAFFEEAPTQSTKSQPGHRRRFNHTNI